MSKLKKPPMQLSVVIPVYNAEATLAVQLDALARQEWSERWEVIFADNGSTDGSRAIAERFRSQLPELRIVGASQKQGVSFARNVGVQAARGGSLAFCDADDEVAPGWVRSMGEALKKHDFVAGALDRRKLNSPQVRAGGHSLQEEGLIEEFSLPYAAGCNIGVRRSVFEAVHGFDEALPWGEDTDFCWRVHLWIRTRRSISCRRPEYTIGNERPSSRRLVNTTVMPEDGWIY